ncbi:glycosyltransferase family 39 protein [Mariniflexile soesokkakense]|uniref:Glycosyltransferase family 39 protein n=1 Tax=Mariniflexile soesokkakense TaxID=1343160 RepID=A0ABV0A9N2_9FLAO
MLNKRIKDININYKLVLLIILISSAILRFYNLGFQSPWLDEVHTLNESNPRASIFDLYGQILSVEQLPPLYFYIVYFLFKLFGYSIVVARAFSALLGVMAVYTIFLLTKELINKKTGIVAALLLCMNYFMIYYSQEARPYMFFTLFVLFSYYRMILFIKNPNTKNAFWYGLAACLMIHAHFIGLFTLFAQCIVLLAYLIFKEGLNKAKFFKGCLLASLILVIFYIPAIDALLGIFKIKSFWIPMPEKGALESIYNNFFGNSEIINFLNFILFVGFIYWLVKRDTSQIEENNDQKLKDWNIIILVSWISLTLLILIIRTYTSVPIVLDRYLISILPAIIILLAIGLTSIRSKYIKTVFIILYVLFFIVDIFIVKKNYHSVFKTQFREVSEFIIDNNSNNDPVVSSLSWYFPYFLNNDKIKTNLIDGSLDNYVNEMVQDSTKAKSFWYVDAHNRPFKIEESTQKYLDSNFFLDNKIDLYDTWARHYSNISSRLIEIDISKYLPLNDINGDKINFWIDEFIENPEYISIIGWAYLDGQDATNSVIQPILIKEGKAIKLLVQNVSRDDITKSSGGKYLLDNSGILSKVFLNKLQPGTYKLGIIVTNNITKKEGLVLTNNTFTKN